ncbi:PREDICTED: aspartic proteinase CDR1-like [Ipomoea nil]|uniref:aspartic proteinase CDR1-like n=1 Tax=Ipomoea nil TaxID=35883 RepID=UPI0009011EA5|nr:PREDICTED: aspartic proteinase CDR1-like [Ipomoea nil]
MSSKSMDLIVVLTLSVFALLSVQTINGVTVELIHPNSPSNPYRNPTNNQFDWIRQEYDNTRSRAAFIHSRLRDDNPSKFKTEMMPYGGGYFMKYSIGTPPFETYAIADTGSDVTWTQCQPCTGCFPEISPIFSPANSNSYQTTLCNSDTCSIFGSICSDQKICQYYLTLGDESHTGGEVATDTLTIGDGSFTNVIFGCGDNNVFFPNVTSGVVGLGYSSVSIVKQLGNKIRGKFAYCLSPQPDSKSYICFGTDAIVSGPDAVSTPIAVSLDKTTYYWLSLESISAGDKNFPVKQSSTSDTSGQTGNVIIDSGTTLTIIPADVFDSLKSELMKQIPATPVDDPRGSFGLCYSTSDKFKVPKVIAHFSGGADVALSPPGLFQQVDEGIFCLAIIPDQDLGIFIFGIMSEVDYFVGYDLKAKRVTFKQSSLQIAPNFKLRSIG